MPASPPKGNQANLILVWARLHCIISASHFLFPYPQALCEVLNIWSKKDFYRIAPGILEGQMRTSLDEQKVASSILYLQRTEYSAIN